MHFMCKHSNCKHQLEYNSYSLEEHEKPQNSSSLLMDLEVLVTSSSIFHLKQFSTKSMIFVKVYFMIWKNDTFWLFNYASINF